MPSLKSFLAQDGLDDDPDPRGRKGRATDGYKTEIPNKDVRQRTKKRTSRSRKEPIPLKVKMAERALIPSNGTLLAVEEMDREIARFEGIMESLYPWDEDGEQIKGKSVQAFYWAAEMRRDYLALRAPYQTPKLSAIALMQNGQPAGPKRITEVNVTILNERGDREYTDAEDEALQIDGEISSDSNEAAA